MNCFRSTIVNYVLSNDSINNTQLDSIPPPRRRNPKSLFPNISPTASLLRKRERNNKVNKWKRKYKIIINYKEIVMVRSVKLRVTLKWKIEREECEKWHFYTENSSVSFTRNGFSSSKDLTLLLASTRRWMILVRAFEIWDERKFGYFASDKSICFLRYIQNSLYFYIIII